MKKYFLYALAAIVSLVIASCSEEVLTDNQSEELVDVTYSISTLSQTTTRATHDEDGAAAKINRYICEVWHVDADDTYTLYKREDKKVDNGTTQTQFNLRLVASHSYKVLFWADYAYYDSQTQALSDLYYVTNTEANKGLQDVAIKTTTNGSGNTDEMDAFYGKDEITNLKGSKNLNVTLTRPFAQLNVITTDIDDIKASEENGTMVPDHVKLTVNAPTKFNVLTGETSESADISYTAAVYFTDSHNKKLNSSDPDFSYCTLAMSYILAPEEEKDLVTVKLDAINSDDVITSPEFSNIPLQRNYRTNIIGDLLTNGVDYTVNVKPDWEGENDEHWTKVATVAEAITALATGNVTNVEVLTAPTTETVIDIPKKYEASNNVSVGIKIPATDKKITFQYNSQDQQTAPANINIVVENSNNVEINCPNSHVTLNGGTYTQITATTSLTTLVIEKDVTIDNLTVSQGGIEIHGTVKAVTISNGANVVVRACEGLSESVYNALKNFIDPEYISVKSGETYDIYKPDARKAGYRTVESSYVPLPAAPVKNGNVWNVNAANAQYVLDGAYGAIDGKTIHFTENITEKLILGRPTKFEGSNTVYRHGGFSNAPLSYDDFIAYKTQSGWTEYSYYNRAISDVTFSANTGVTVAGFTACGGNHVYGTTNAPIYDYVRDNGTWCHDANNGYYVYVELKNFKFNGLTFNGKTDIATSSDKTVIDNFEFNGCTFDINNTTSSNQAIRYYNENNNGNVKDLIVNNCTFKNCYQAIYTQHIKDITISGCTVTNTGHNAFAIQSGTHGAVDHGEVKIINNNISGCGDRAIRFGDIADGTEITITGNNASYGDGTTSSSEEAIKATSIADGVTVTVDNNNWNNFKDPYNPEFLPAVAKIGETKYSTLDKAFAAVTDGETIEIVMAGTYTLPSPISNITIKGVDGVVFNAMKAYGQSVSKLQNVKFESVKFIFGSSNYTGFQHSQSVTFTKCTIEGRFNSYGSMLFDQCTFNSPESDYSMWCYAGDVTYKKCTINCNGKFANVYNEGNALPDENGNKIPWKVIAENCTFNSTKANKAAFNIKATCNSTPLYYDVEIKNCTANGENWPAASTSKTLVVGSALWQVDDIKEDVDSKIKVTVNGDQVYPKVN